MTDESAFQAALDEAATLVWTDETGRREEMRDRYADTCAVFADWLEEHDDWRAAGYRWLSRNRKVPRIVGQDWDWWRSSDAGPPDNLLPSLWAGLPGQPDAALPDCKSYPTRRDAEWALCTAVRSVEPGPLERDPPDE